MASPYADALPDFAGPGRRPLRLASVLYDASEAGPEEFGDQHICQFGRMFLVIQGATPGNFSSGMGVFFRRF